MGAQDGPARLANPVFQETLYEVCEAKYSKASDRSRGGQGPDRGIINIFNLNNDLKILTFISVKFWKNIIYFCKT